jgi:hypothetical protein
MAQRRGNPTTGRHPASWRRASPRRQHRAAALSLVSRPVPGRPARGHAARPPGSQRLGALPVPRPDVRLCPPIPGPTVRRVPAVRLPTAGLPAPHTRSLDLLGCVYRPSRALSPAASLSPSPVIQRSSPRGRRLRPRHHRPDHGDARRPGVQHGRRAPHDSGLGGLGVTTPPRPRASLVRRR